MAPAELTLPMLVAADPGLVKVGLFGIVCLAVIVGFVVYALFSPPSLPDIRLAVEDDTADDLFDLAAAVSEVEPPADADLVPDGPDVLLRPVNEPRPSGWPGVDEEPPNRGDYFDRASRRSNELNGRWITKRQQVQEAQIGIAEFERFLEAEAERQARWDSATTQEIQGGDPGE